MPVFRFLGAELIIMLAIMLVWAGNAMGADRCHGQAGIASFYGPGFHGRRTASGERFNQNAMTAAHRTLPFGARVRVVNLGNGKAVVVRVTDRGGFAKYGRIIDLSKAAATQLEMLRAGTASVCLERLR